MIYLDHAATTPLDPRVLEAMLPHLRDTWGNPSSPHSKGREARAALDAARESIAEHLGVAPHEVIFTASGSEANTLALFGRAAWWTAEHGAPGRMVLLSIEHECSLKAATRLQTMGWDIVLLPVDQHGILELNVLEQALTEDTALVSLQWANNEVGSIQPVVGARDLCAERGIAFHCDGVQPVGQLPLPSPLPPLFTMAAHKFYGPKGAAVLAVRDGVGMQPVIFGGGQEFGLRAGTENVPAFVGMAKALDIAVTEQPEEQRRLTALRDTFIAELERVPGITLNGPRGDVRLPNNVHVRIAGRKGETIVMQLDLQGICASAGPACSTGAAQPSHVLAAMGCSGPSTEENVRLTLGRSTTKEDLQHTVQALACILKQA